MISPTTKLQQKLDNVPELPGIYKMLDANSNIIYVGKSKCLRKRVKSYFAGTHKWSKINKLVLLTHDIEYIVTDTHLEARILECDLIKEIKPHFNSLLKNDSEYVYLEVENYNKRNVLSIAPERNKDTYGLFRNKHSLSNIIQCLKHIFPITKENGAYSAEYKIIPIDLDQLSFEKNREIIVEVLTDSICMNRLLDMLKDKMEEAASEYKYETASKYRDIIQGLQYIHNVIWRYTETMSNDIVIKIPLRHGYKLFYVSEGKIVYKQYLDEPTNVDMDLFIEKGTFMKTTISDYDDEKTAIDYRDIIYSEINTLPNELVTIIG